MAKRPTESPTNPAPLLVQVRTRTGQARRRAGLTFGPAWTDVDLTDLTPEQGLAIEADALLERREVPA